MDPAGWATVITAITALVVAVASALKGRADAAQAAKKTELDHLRITIDELQEENTRLRSLNDKLQQELTDYKQQHLAAMVAMHQELDEIKLDRAATENQLRGQIKQLQDENAKLKAQIKELQEKNGLAADDSEERETDGE